MREDIFSGYHPIVNFIYFVIIIGCSMFMLHPVFLILSCLGGFFYYVYIKRWKAFKTALWLMLPVFLISAAVNPLFNHQGVTIIKYLRTGNPLTLESLIYGLATGFMLVSVLNWFSCYQTVMTSDKFIYLFGKIIPSMSLVLSMVLRLVPKFKIQFEKVAFSQKCIGKNLSEGNMIKRVRNGMSIFSIVTTWALENSVETADSMRSRGYGLRGRTNYSIYRFDTRDKIATLLLGVMGATVVAGILMKKVHCLYYPIMQINDNTPWAWAVYISYGCLCFFPWVINIIEDVKWHYLKSKI